MKILYFPKYSSNIYNLRDPCFYTTVQEFRLLNYVMLLHAAVLGMTLKGLVKFISDG